MYVRPDQEGLFKLVTLDRILNRITDICQINQQNISSCIVINNRIKKIS
jgi:hypothetical protein